MTAFTTPSRADLRALALVLIIALVTWLGFTQLRTPDPQPATRTEIEFSAERAMVHLEAIATEPRGIGQPGHDAARDYLVAELTAMGLAPEIQTAPSVLLFPDADTFNTGTISNVIVRIPGTANTGAIAINAHYDGGSTGPAAGDNGVGVVATLEVVRALLAGPVLANDLIIVFSDGEEFGDIGAAAFTQQHPWAGDIRVAINSEAQGTGGPAILYATNEDDGWVTGEYFDVAPDPAAYSLLPELVRALPGMRLACDLQDYIEMGASGLGFVFARDTPAYHTARDSVANVDQGSLQQEGDNTLAAVRHFGSMDLSDIPDDPNRVFFTLPGAIVIHYSSSFVLLLTIMATALVAGVIVYGLRRDLFSLRGTLAGVGVFLLGLVAILVMIDLLWVLLRTINSDWTVLMIGSYQTTEIVIAFSLLALALMALLYGGMQRFTRWQNLGAGALVVWLLLLWAITFVAPSATYLLFWPLLFALLSYAWLLLRRDSAGLGLAILTVAILPAALIIPGTAYQVVALINRLEYMANLTGGLPLLGVWVLFVVPLVGLYLPHLAALSGEKTPRLRPHVPIATALAAVLLIGWTLATTGFDADHPRPDHIAYEWNVDTGEARWFSFDPETDSYTSQFLGDNPDRADVVLQPGTDVEAFVAPAPLAQLTPPEVIDIQTGAPGDTRIVSFRIISPRLAPDMSVVITTGGQITGATVDGLPLDLATYAPATDGELRLSNAGITDAGIAISLTLTGTDPIVVEIRETGYGLPVDVAGPITPRTDAQMLAAGLPPDATIIHRTVTIP